MMDKFDNHFSESNGLEYTIDLLRKSPAEQINLLKSFPILGLGEFDTLDLLAPHVLSNTTRLDKPDALAHMDPPTPWITWATSLWNARLNQNMLGLSDNSYLKNAIPCFNLFMMNILRHVGFNFEFSHNNSSKWV